MASRKTNLWLTGALAAGFTLASAGQAGAAASPSTTQGATPQTAPAPAAGQPLSIRVTGVEGQAELRLGDGQPWLPAKVGMIVGQGAEFRTGPHSVVQFVIGTGHVVTLDHLGNLKVLTAIAAAGKIKTDLGMKYGRTRYDIEAGGAEHESTIHSPGATLAVLDTHFELTDWVPFNPSAISYNGKVKFTFDGFGTHFFGTDHFTQVDTQHPDAAAFGYAQTANPAGDDHGALTNPEVGYWGEYPGNGPDVRFNYLANYHAVTSNTVILQSTPALGPNTGAFVQATLQFLLVASPSAGINLLVVSPLNETLGASGNPSFMGVAPQPQVSSGGQLSVNQATGTKATVVQTATWNQFFPAGTYTVGATDQGIAPAKFTVETVINGHVTDKTFSGTLNPGSTYTVKQVKVP